MLCGHSPYNDIQSDISLLLNTILEGDRPKKPENAVRLGFNDELWTIVEQCWHENRAERPRIEEILPYLNDATAFWYTREF